MRGIKLDVRVVALLLPLLLTSCAHKKNQIQPPLAPPVEDTPPPAPSKAPANLPPPVITVPQPAQPAPPAPSTTAQKPEPPKRPHRHRKPAPAKPAQEPSDSERAASSAPPEVSAIGQLSSGEPSDVHKRAADSIADTEQKLNRIHRKLNEQEQKTADQIREFLKQARAALTSGDTDGAYTLALKAKVLLGELIP